MRLNDSLQKAATADWATLVQGRGQSALHLENVRSLLLIIPASSGDIALATTVVRYIRQRAPASHITLATTKPNIPLARLCPGVSATIELPPDYVQPFHRREYLERYKGQADVVLYTPCWPEDRDLIIDYDLNLLETIWLLAGVAEGIPPQPQRVWLQSSLTREDALNILRSCLVREQAAAAMAQAAAPVSASLRTVLQTRSIHGSLLRAGASQARRRLRESVKSWTPVSQRKPDAERMGEQFVILSTQSATLPSPPAEVVRMMVRLLRASGRTVLHNVRTPLDAATGTLPLLCTYKEFLCLREAGIPFVGWRNGLCDIAAASSPPMCVFYPPTFEFCRDPLATYGFKSMRIAGAFQEHKCQNVQDVVSSNFAAQLTPE